MTTEIIVGDNLKILREMESGSVQCVVTSPPYWGLRTYGVEKAIGMEETLDSHIENLVDIFREVRRVLHDDGTLWLNYGDMYTGSQRIISVDKNSTQATNRHSVNICKSTTTPFRKFPQGFKPKDLILAGAMLAMRLQADGWYLRSEIIWSKPNPMPESVTDRPTCAHEKIYLLSKSSRYFYDYMGVKTPSVWGNGK